MTWPFGQLERLARDPAAALELGKAAEHLVCADLILAGYRCYLSDQGLPYDLIVDLEGRLVRVQVKATCFAKDVNTKGSVERLAYSFSVRRRGKGGSSRLDESHCDLVALVALDIRTIAYLPIEMAGQTVQLSPPGVALRTQFRSGSQWARTIAEFPFSEAVSGDLSIYRAARRKLTHCPQRHEYTDNNTYINADGSRVCRACTRLRYQRRSINTLEAANG